MATEDGRKKRGLDALSPTQQFIILGCGVFVFFGTHNVLQEAMMKIPGFEFGVMLGYMEVVGYVSKRGWIVTL
jgi:adenosine 3'-phospho 5'-phosphosulfate transporter B3